MLIILWRCFFEVFELGGPDSRIAEWELRPRVLKFYLGERTGENLDGVVTCSGRGVWGASKTVHHD